MATLAIRQFQGLRPRVAEQALHDELATVAKNVNLVSGELRPLLAALSVHQFQKVEASQSESESEPSVVIPTTPPDRCVAVRIDQTPVAISRTAAGEAARSPPQFTVSAVAGYTPPLAIQWYIDGAAQPLGKNETFVLPQSAYGRREQRLTISAGPPPPLRFSPTHVNISVVLSNPCGRARADTSFTLT